MTPGGASGVRQTLPGARVVTACPHCLLPVEGPLGTFCCHGCAQAADIIEAAGLNYYGDRLGPAPRSRSREPVHLVEPAADADGKCEASFQVEGIRCASCVWLVEQVLAGQPGVQSVSVSYATGRARLEWDASSVSLAGLTGVIGTLGYAVRPMGDRTDDADLDLLVRLAVATFCALNTMAVSAALYSGWGPGMEPRFVALFQWLALLLSAPVATWAAVPFYQRAVAGLRVGLLHVDVPISLAVVVLSVHGLVATVQGVESYLDSMTMVVALLLASRFVESRGRRRASDAASAMAAQLPGSARRVERGGTVVVPSSSLRTGDHIALAGGDEIPADAQITSGHGTVDLSLVTGESAPVSCNVGDPLLAGAAWVSGTAVAVVERAGDATVVRGMAVSLLDALDRPSEPAGPAAVLADRIAPWFTGATLVCAGVAAWLAPDLEAALLRSVAVMVVACPCALALSRPLCGAVGLGTAARNGLLVRSVNAFYSLGSVTRVAVDKTGTLTGGRPEVVDGSDATLRLALAVERASQHPIAVAIRDAGLRRQIPVPMACDLRALPDGGVQGTVDGVCTRVVPAGANRVEVQVREGVWRTVGELEFKDRVRPGTEASIRALKGLGLPVTLISGDHGDVVWDLGQALGIADVVARARPDDKARWVHDHQAAGYRVLFVGDGNNDAHAIAVASVGVAMVGGASPALLAADAVTRAGIEPLAAAIALSRRVRRAANFTLLGSLAYNALAVTLAMAGLINPLIAALLMPASSLAVVAVAMTVGRRR